MKKKITKSKLKVFKTLKKSMREENFDEILNEDNNNIDSKSDQELSNEFSKKKIFNEENNYKENSAWRDENESKIEINLDLVPRLRKLKKNAEEKIISGEEYQRRLADYYKKTLKYTDFFKWGLKQNNVNEKSTQFQEEINRIENFFENYEKELPNSNLIIKKFGYILKKDYHNSVVKSIDFKKNSNILASVGLDKILKIYSIQENNSKNNLNIEKSIYFESFPITNFKFLEKNNSVLLSGMKKYLLLYNLQEEKTEMLISSFYSNKFDKYIDNFSIDSNEKYIVLFNNNGNILVLSAETHQFLFELKMNEKCNDVKFSFDSKYLYSVGELGNIYVWDLTQRKIINIEKDFGSSCSNYIDVGEVIATGNKMGYVNIYNVNKENNNFKLMKSYDNLTTSISGITLNNNSEICCAFSRWKKNAIRLINVKEKCVFKSWPNFKTNLHFINCAKFSHDNKYLAIGNDVGYVCCFNISHYN